MATGALSMLALIEAKRDGHAHSDAAIEALIADVTAGRVPDYQVAAWLMAVVWRGMTRQETAALTRAMAASGACLDLRDLPGPTVDKHSTGGVGDKTTLVVAPLAAATGLTVAKMSGRGLGHTGGTLDKLESIPGLTVDLDIARFKRQAREIRLVIAGQTEDLAPADRILYAMRDVTGTVPSLPLIAASIMSKKLAAGAQGVVLDVKVGAGAFLPRLEAARELADAMIALGAAADPPRRVAALLSAMDQPLGHAVGNALEVQEAILTLLGEGPADLTELALSLTGLLHVVAGTAPSIEEALPRVRAALAGGEALARFRAMVGAQGGDVRFVDAPETLPTAPIVREVVAERDGWVASVNARAIGDAAAALGAGRFVKGAAVDPGVGVVLSIKTGGAVRRGHVLAVVHARSDDAAAAAERAVRSAYDIAEAPPLDSAAPIVLERRP